MTAVRPWQYVPYIFFLESIVIAWTHWSYTSYWFLKINEYVINYHVLQLHLSWYLNRWLMSISVSRLPHFSCRKVLPPQSRVVAQRWQDSDCPIIFIKHLYCQERKRAVCVPLANWHLKCLLIFTELKQLCLPTSTLCHVMLKQHTKCAQ